MRSRDDTPNAMWHECNNEYMWRIQEIYKQIIFLKITLKTGKPIENMEKLKLRQSKTEIFKNISVKNWTYSQGLEMDKPY